MDEQEQRNCTHFGVKPSLLPHTLQQLKSNNVIANTENIEEKLFICQDLCFWIKNITLILCVIFSALCNNIQITLEKVYDNN